MNPQESKELTDFMRRLRDERGLSILLIEHDMQVVMEVVRAHHRARPRQQDRRGHAAGGAAEPAGDRGLPRQAGRPSRWPLLEVKDVHTYYGNIEALKGISIEVEEGECVTLIGSNGAGKSTTLRSISGLTPPRQGSIRFEGREITRDAAAGDRLAWASPTRPRDGTSSRA